MNTTIIHERSVALRALRWWPPVLIGLVVIIGGMGLLLLQTSVVASTGYQVENLQELKAALEQRNYELEAEVASLKSMERIEDAATHQMKMVRPQSYLYLSVDVPPPASDQYNAPQLAYTPAASQPWWQALPFVSLFPANKGTP